MMCYLDNPIHASYLLPVRTCQILQSRLLQVDSHPSHPCGLLDPLIHFEGQENLHLPRILILLSSDIPIFEYRCPFKAQTICISNSGLNAYLNRFYILISILTPDNLVRLNPLLLIHETVITNTPFQKIEYKKTLLLGEFLRRAKAILYILIKGLTLAFFDKQNTI